MVNCACAVWTVIQFCVAAAAKALHLYTTYIKCFRLQVAEGNIIWNFQWLSATVQDICHLIQSLLLNYFDHLPSNYSDSNFDGYIDESASE